MAYESDYECPDCGGAMKLRSGKFGEFYGCRSYPDCTGTRDANGNAKGERTRRRAPRPHANAAAKQNEPAPDLEVEDTSPPAPEPEAAAPAINEDGVDLPGPEPVTGVAPCKLALDEHQQRVVAWREGAALVAAGAGSGKSTVLVERTAALLMDGVLPEHIVTLVYNASAAKDFRAKLDARLGVDTAKRCAAQTFHGWAFAQLRRWFPGSPEFRKDRIIGTADGPNGYWIAGAVTKRLGLPGEVDAYIRASELIREALIDVQSPEALEQVTDLKVSGGSSSVAERLLLFTTEYQAEKAERHAIDFADMLYRVGLEILRGTPLAAKLGATYAHVQVDEAQDINVARMTIAKHLAKGAKSFLCVGDMRQSVYSFTGARPDLFRSLINAPVNAELLTLPVNRRSTTPIVNAGNVVAAHRDWNLGGACSPAPGHEEGEPVRVWRAVDTETSEASMVASEILARSTPEGTPLTDEKGKANYAILTRTNAQAATFEAALIARGLPVRVLGTSGGVWTTTIGREIRAYLAAAEGRAVDDITKIANKPVRYLKGEDTKTAINWAKKGTISLGEALRAVARQKNPYRNPPRHGAWDLAEDLAVLAAAPWVERCKAVSQFLIMDLKARAAVDTASDVVGKVTKPDEDKEATYEALCAAASALGSLDAIEQQIKKVKEDENGPAVEISTMHKAKGAEWHTVFVTGVTEGVLPHAKAEDVEEERRLFYVAVTRAKKVCTVSAGGEPSEFFEEFAAAVAPVEQPEQAPLFSDEPVVGDAPLCTGGCGTAMPADGPARCAPCDEGARLLNENADRLRKNKVRVEDALGRVRTDIEAWRSIAAERGEAEPRPTTEGPGSRFVNVTQEGMEEILAPLGFAGASKDVTMRAGQRVYELGLPGRGKGYYHVVRVYTTIPLGDSDARELGEDSIKVAALRVSDDGETKPLHRKLPYACRTRNWRTTLLDKLVEVLDIIESREGLKTKGD